MIPSVHTCDDVRELVAQEICVAAVLDPLIHAPLLRQVGIGMMDQIILSSGSVDDANKASLPRLVHLYEKDEPSSILLDAAGEGQGLFLVARAGCAFVHMADVASHLCHALTPEGGMAWFRWYDPYLFRAVFPTLDGHQLAHFYEGAVHSFLVADQTTITEYARPEHTQGRNTDYLRFRPDQVELLEQAHFQFYVDELTRFARGNDGALRGEDYATSRARVASYVQTAEDCGFSTMNYLTEFVKLVLDTREQCLHSSELAQLLSMNKGQEEKMTFWRSCCYFMKTAKNKDIR